MGRWVHKCLKGTSRQTDNDESSHLPALWMLDLLGCCSVIVVGVLGGIQISHEGHVFGMASYG